MAVRREKRGRFCSILNKRKKKTLSERAASTRRKGGKRRRKMGKKNGEETKNDSYLDQQQVKIEIGELFSGLTTKSEKKTQRKLSLGLASRNQNQGRNPRLCSAATSGKKGRLGGRTEGSKRHIRGSEFKKI